MNQLTLKQMQMYTKMFKEVDLNHDGRLNRSEVKGLCVELGFSYDDSQVKQLFSELDKDKSGDVTLDEFLFAMQPITNGKKRCATFRRMFRRMDVNKDGFLSVSELHRALASAVGEGEEPLSAQEVKDMIAHVDVNGDGRLDYEEFLLLFKLFKAFAEA
ncbi:calmodulin-4-like [Haliotis rubra]|uniref:calmodulin-4-like n=1 Tax=Haliotis rubra TaxID=36100 RepID=UPI001EE53243|nr:calmodulin-4-like [Haliotis rubra]